MERVFSVNVGINCKKNIKSVTTQSLDKNVVGQSSGVARLVIIRSPHTDNAYRRNSVINAPIQRFTAALENGHLKWSV